MVEFFALAAILIMMAVCTWEIKSSCKEIMDRLEILHGIINGDYRTLGNNDVTLINAIRDMNKSYADLMLKQATILQEIAATLNNISELTQNSEQDEQTYEQTEEKDGEKNQES